MKEPAPFTRRFISWCGVFWPSWQNLALAALALLLLTSLAWSDPISGWTGSPLRSGGDPLRSGGFPRSSGGGASIDKTTATPTPEGFVETPTPYPPEILNNYKQTNGVIFIGGLIVLVILAGAIGVNRSRRKE